MYWRLFISLWLSLAWLMQSEWYGATFDGNVSRQFSFQGGTYLVTFGLKLKYSKRLPSIWGILVACPHHCSAFWISSWSLNHPCEADSPLRLGTQLTWAYSQNDVWTEGNRAFYRCLWWTFSIDLSPHLSSPPAECQIWNCKKKFLSHDSPYFWISSGESWISPRRGRKSLLNLC